MKGMKWIGAILVILACGGCGLMMVASDRAEERDLRQLERILEWVGCELACRMWPLPVLMRQVAEMAEGSMKRVLLEFGEELDQNAAPDACSCMEAVLARHPQISKKSRILLSDLGRSLGRYDLQGQLREIVNIQQQAQRVLQEHTCGREERLRCYQTLGLCAGFGLAILLL